MAEPNKPESTTSDESLVAERARGHLTLMVALIIVFNGLLVAMVFLKKGDGAKTGSAYVAQPKGTLTYSKDIAPIIHQRCAFCHRPGQAAPFDLLAYADVQKRTEQIKQVTTSGLMPPWLPDSSKVAYLEDRRLTVDELGKLHQWIDEGAAAGNAADLPTLPQWSDDWQLGQPDLVIQMAEPFTLPAEGKDVYRNFVIPIPLAENKFVEAVEFRPGNHRIVHHAAMKLDRTPLSHQRDAAESGAGFSGMALPESTEAPGGQFLNWQPGKLAYRTLPGLAWPLARGSDFILQLHLHPTGKPETVQSSIGFYFTDTRPTNTTFKLILDSSVIDIPAGKADYVVQDSYTLPVDVEALAVFPHTHYLGKDLKAYAELPGGTRQWLLHIPHWNFEWQGDYRFAQPIALPRGTKVVMEFTYDNSTNNLNNPRNPPQRVKFGPESTDEMGELWLQLLPRNLAERDALARDYNLNSVQKIIARQEFNLRENPADVPARLLLGKALLSIGKHSEAEKNLRGVVQLDPRNDDAHYHLGVLHRMRNQVAAAKAEFENALRINPNNHKAHGNLGLIYLEQRNPNAAEPHFRRALEINPTDEIAIESLREIEQARRR